VLLDDLVAGVYANLIAQVALRALVLVMAAAAPVATAVAAPIIPAPSSPPVMEQKITTGQAAVLGVVEGLTEYLPVSSTGHLILTGQAMGLTRFGDGSGLFGPKVVKVPAIDAFEIVIQLGAILAVAGLYRKRVAQMAMGLVGRSGDGLRLAGLLLVAFLPSAVVGLLLHKPIKEHLFGPMPVCIALAVGGAAMIAAEYFFWIRNRARPRTASLDSVAFRQALIVGLVQCLSLWPGTSRSMVTIVAALIVGMDMVTAAEFSFLLALPTLGAATLYEGAKNLDVLLASAGPGGLVIGLVVSWIVAVLAVKGFVRWLTRHGLIPFGVYRLLLAGVLYAWFLSVR
jgi:undecaprenyl-diphosphatase